MTTDAPEQHQRRSEGSAPHLAAALLLARAKSSADTAIGGALTRVGLSLDDLLRLRLLGVHSEGLARDQLAWEMSETRSQTLRATLPLVKLGWLTRTDDGAFVLTDSGRALIDQAEGIAEKAAERWFADAALDVAQVAATLKPWTEDTRV
ncbi:MAG: hypothetical protein ACTH2U_06835 [Brevibacterium sp.]|uniref:hypothetical protein n=1 Tax=unclassified Brevibacterium TaxID=2614124 RepID=UPI001E4072FD|nr:MULTISPECIES: hypothetical protein [unclassified Brevibacterium]MCD1286262.1 hypothetical protein [Brevibacterium sp. CCUG 69071]MDK8433623.1 hypothetical protein [Brevibacterium sp. H-BE7]